MTKKEWCFSAFGVTVHLYTVPNYKSMYWVRRYTFTEYVALRRAFEWTTFFGFVFFGHGFAVSNFNQQKEYEKQRFRQSIDN